MLRFVPQTENYFAMFANMGELLTQASDLLVQMCEDGSDRQEYAKQIQQMEVRCDELRYAVAVKLNDSFITPIDREDIYALIRALDDIADDIENVAAHLVIYRIDTISPQAKYLASLLSLSAREVSEVICKLRPHGDALPHFMKIHELKKKGNDAYRIAIASMFESPSDPFSLMKWRDLYRQLADSIGQCESVAHVLEGIILKHA